MNTRIEYMYRDGDNYKQYGRVIVEGEITWEQIQPRLSEGTYFIPDQVGLEELQSRMTSFPDQQSDHVWHELHEEDVNSTWADPTERITAEELLQLFEAARDNWQVQEAMERLGLEVGHL